MNGPTYKGEGLMLSGWTAVVPEARMTTLLNRTMSLKGLTVSRKSMASIGLLNLRERTEGKQERYG